MFQSSQSTSRTSVPHTSQSSLFLFELILATAFLALSSVVCIRLYLYARSISRSSAAQTHAIAEAQNIADSWIASDGTLRDALTLYQEALDMTVPDASLPDSALALGAAANPDSDTAEDSAMEFSSDSDAAEDDAFLYYNSSWSCLNGTQDTTILVGADDAGATYTPYYTMVLQLSADEDNPAIKVLSIALYSLQGAAGSTADALYSLEVQQYESD